MSPDIGNALFELVGAFINYLNVRQARIDKFISGVSVWPAVFFTSWGIWNLFYYPFLGQYYSAAAAVPIFVINGWWVYLYCKYGRRKYITGT